MKWKYLVAWLPGILIAVFNGALREFWYRQWLSELGAHQLSVVSFIILFGIYLWFVVRWLRVSSGREAMVLGLIWLGLTIAFEFVFGHFVMGHPWEQLMHDYNVMAGRLWIVVLVWIAIGPWVMFRLRKSRTVVGPSRE